MLHFCEKGYVMITDSAHDIYCRGANRAQPPTSPRSDFWPSLYRSGPSVPLSRLWNAFVTNNDGNNKRAGDNSLAQRPACQHTSIIKNEIPYRIQSITGTLHKLITAIIEHGRCQTNSWAWLAIIVQRVLWKPRPVSKIYQLKALAVGRSHV